VGSVAAGWRAAAGPAHNSAVPATGDWKDVSMTGPLDVVQRFCVAWSKVDIDEIMSFFSDDAVYHNIPVDPLVGHEAIRAMIESFTTGVDRIEFDVLHAVAQGNLVLTERVDRFFSEDRTISLPVMGAFEVDGEKITAWRDYFDLNQFMSQVPT
jgi:limonene-1,2-epoxide hydrolase